MNRVLFVEDDIDFQRSAIAALDGACDVTIAGSLAEAQAALDQQTFDLLLLDIGLPDGNGMIFCRKLRAQEKFQELPIVFCSSQADVANRIQGLAFGGDDYVVKPFDPGELKARVVTRIQRKTKMLTAFDKGIFHVDLLAQKIVMKDFEGKPAPLALTPTEFKMLVLFLRNERKLFSREELLHSVWGEGTHVSEHAIETHTSTLRKKLGDAGRFLKAIPKKGYYFTFEEDPDKAGPK